MSLIHKFFEIRRECEELKIKYARAISHATDEEAQRWSQTAKLEAEVNRLKAALVQSLSEHDTGHSPCSCIEIKSMLKL